MIRKSVDMQRDTNKCLGKTGTSEEYFESGEFCGIFFYITNPVNGNSRRKEAKDKYVSFHEYDLKSYIFLFAVLYKM
jgi:hypothetical protein